MLVTFNAMLLCVPLVQVRQSAAMWNASEVCAWQSHEQG
nr:MAG TPA: hypothetical protein [Bacteriophage sp.]